MHFNVAAGADPATRVAERPECCDGLDTPAHARPAFGPVTEATASQAGDAEHTLRAAVDALRARIAPGPAIGVVLGSGLGAFAEALDARVAVPFAEIPGMPAAGVLGHAGLLVAGRTPDAGVPVLALQGRVHLYEGHAPRTVVHGVRLLARLGARSVILTNAAGAVRNDLRAGDLMWIEDHLNLTGHNALAGVDPGPGARFVDMGAAYDHALATIGLAVSRARGVPLARGVYAGVLGPSYETPAEVRMLRALGADAVGMSTVLEAIAARQLGMRVAGISCITNAPGAASIDHREVARVANATGPTLVAFLTALLSAIWPTEPR